MVANRLPADKKSENARRAKLFPKLRQSHEYDCLWLITAGHGNLNNARLASPPAFMARN